MVTVIGLDIGGANTKAAVVDGSDPVRIASEPFEVWRDPHGMSGVIERVVGELGVDGAPVALTTTAELVDAFASKREGVLHVLRAAAHALPGRRLRVMTTGGELIGLDAARAAPLPAPPPTGWRRRCWWRARCPTRSSSTVAARPPT